MKKSMKHYLRPTSFIVLLFLLVIASMVATNFIIDANRVNYEESVSEEITVDIAEKFSAYLSKIEAIHEFVNEHKESGIDYDEFYTFSSALFFDDESVENISIAPDAIHEFVYPIEQQDIVGYNLLEDEREHVVEAVTRARDNNEIVISGPYPNRTNPDINIVVIRYPIYHDNGDFYGLINVVLKTSILFHPHESSQYQDVIFNVVDEDDYLLYGDILEHKSENLKTRSLEQFGWKITFGRSTEFQDRIIQENVLKRTVYIVIFIVILIGGTLFTMNSGRSWKERDILNDKLYYMSYHDSLTSLSNRRLFEEKLIEFDSNEYLPLTIVMSDINGLKLVNDAFGHSVGDELLKTAAHLLIKHVRKDDILARIGGDEFVILMPKTTVKQAESVVSKIVEDSNDTFIESIKLSISFGIDSKSIPTQDIQNTFRTAEDLMYRTKLLEIPSMRSDAIEAILNTLHEKDNRSEIHSRIVSDISEKLAIKVGLNNQQTNEIKTAGLLHDIGKIIVPIEILQKTGKLTDEEYKIIQDHPEIGFRILNSTHNLRSISDIVLNHHERWDGKGYPRGLKQEEIPLQARIISIADAFDAMTSDRTYRSRFTYEEALKEIVDHSGTQFDPDLVQLFVTNFKYITKDL